MDEVDPDATVERLRQLVGEAQVCFEELGIQGSEASLSAMLRQLPDLLDSPPITDLGPVIVRDAVLATAVLTHLVAELARFRGETVAPVGVCVLSDPSGLIYSLYGTSGWYTLCTHAPPHRTP